MENSNASIGKVRRALVAISDYPGRMNNGWRARLIERMERLGYNPKTLSIKAGLGNTAVHDMLKRSRSPGIEAVQSVGNVLGMSLAELIDGENRPPIRVPIIGETTEFESWSPYKLGKNLPDILDLPTSNDDLIAIRVLGNSMAPRYQKGDLVIGSRTFGNAADNYIGLPCIIKTEAEKTYIKVLTRGSAEGQYTLRSYDPTTSDIQDVTLLWFARIVAIMPHSG